MGVGVGVAVATLPPVVLVPPLRDTFRRIALAAEVISRRNHVCDVRMTCVPLPKEALSRREVTHVECVLVTLDESSPQLASVATPEHKLSSVTVLVWSKFHFSPPTPPPHFRSAYSKKDIISSLSLTAVGSQPDQGAHLLHGTLHPVRLPHLRGAACRHLQAHRGLERAGGHLLRRHHAHHHRLRRLCRWWKT